MNRGIRTPVLALALCAILASNTARAGEMHDAAAEGDLEEIKRLLAEGAEVDQKGIASPVPSIKSIRAKYLVGGS